ncbi:hypothetical protein ACO0SA_001607 [Hanseniaspora valbyensis]
MKVSSKKTITKNQKPNVLGNSTNIINQTPIEQSFSKKTLPKKKNLNDNVDKIFERFVSQQSDCQNNVQISNLNSSLLQTNLNQLPNNYFLNSKCTETGNNENEPKLPYPQSNYYYQQYQQQFYQKNLQMFSHRQNPAVSSGSNSLFGNFNYSFPANFNPRSVSNMPFNEKVTKWMDSIPIFIITEDIIENHCYTPDVSMFWEEEELDDFFDNYYEDFECADMEPLASADEIIHFQCKRFDCLNKKLYSLEKEYS